MTQGTIYNKRSNYNQINENNKSTYKKSKMLQNIKTQMKKSEDNTVNDIAILVSLFLRLTNLRYYLIWFFIWIQLLINRQLTHKLLSALIQILSFQIPRHSTLNARKEFDIYYSLISLSSFDKNKKERSKKG